MFIETKFRDSLEYDDVFIVPQYSDILSRSEVNTSVKIGNLTLKIPIISANMSSVSESEMCVAMYKSGAISGLHRFLSIEQNVIEYQDVKYTHESECFVSVGVNRDSKERAEALYNAGARYFIIDIAHGNSSNMMEMLTWMKKKWGNEIHVMAGNVCTPEAVENLEKWGADSIKLNIGPGSQCSTKDVTGVTLPTFTTILKCADVAMVPLVSDGGFSNIGDFSKALAAGASLCMSGKFFSATTESPGEIITNSNGSFKKYYGMASATAMKKIRPQDETLPTPEGKESLISFKGSAVNVLNDIAGGIRSSMSYVGARNLIEFRSQVTFGTRKNPK